jgi:general secretion pathway protein D
VQVTPQITDGDRLLVQYQVSLSTFVGDSADPNLPPPRQETKLASQATVPDGYTVVLGGLEVETETDAETRVPVLGSLPLLGALFKSRSKTSQQSRFYVFLRCSVLRSTSFEDLRYLSAPALATAGIDDGVPVVEPRVIR